MNIADADCYVQHAIAFVFQEWLHLLSASVSDLIDTFVKSLIMIVP
jgi:hypothetical protein